MAIRLNLKSALIVLFLCTGSLTIVSCKKEIIHPNGLNSEQLIAGRLDGTWTTPSKVITPENVPAEVFGGMRLIFTTDENGNPASFLAQECPIIFGKTVGTWTISESDENAKVTLTGVEPVDNMEVIVNSSSLTLSFFMGWENTDTKETGKGKFQVTLQRQ
jgi:hypothetical protein